MRASRELHAVERAFECAGEHSVLGGAGEKPVRRDVVARCRIRVACVPVRDDREVAERAFRDPGREVLVAGEGNAGVVRAEVALEVTDQIEPRIFSRCECVPAVRVDHAERHVPRHHLGIGGHRPVVEVVLIEQHLVVEEPVGERIRLPVPRAEELVREIELARHHQQPAVKAGEVAGQAVPAVLDHQAAIRIRRHRGEPAVVVGERRRRRGIEVP